VPAALYPGVSSYTAAYDRFRLLRRNTVLAHCVHLSDDELDLIKARNSGISICADSNFNLRSGTARVTDMLDKGIKVGLGTDVSGGLSLGILSAMCVSFLLSSSASERAADLAPSPSCSRATSTASKTICFHKRDSLSSSPSANSSTSSDLAVGPDGVARPAGFFADKHLSLSALFYLATLGGAQVANVDERVGNFVVGKEFDALLVQTAPASSSVLSPAAEGSSATSNGEAGEQAFEDELRFALEGDAVEQRGEAYNPALLTSEDETIERVFEKFLFSVRPSRSLPGPSLLERSAKSALPCDAGRRPKPRLGLCARAGRRRRTAPLGLDEVLDRSSGSLSLCCRRMTMSNR